MTTECGKYSVLMNTGLLETDSEVKKSLDAIRQR